MADSTHGALGNIVFLSDIRATNSLTLEYAVRFADHYDAHLTGVYIKPFPDLPMGYYGTLSSRYLELLEQADDEATKKKEEFESIANRYGIRFSWIEQTGASETIANNALHYADFGIIGQHSKSDDDYQSGWISALILSSGRPIIVVPNTGWNKSIGEKIVVAWDESKPATRAVHDAMPLLLRATETIDVVHVQDRSNKGTDLAPALCSHLARHGLKVNAYNSTPSAVEAGHGLMSLANVDKADLLVMGAWGHTRLREFVLGGTTRTVLAETGVPVLMSH